MSGVTCFDDYKRFWELSCLVVDPAFGRRGLGSQLIEWGQQRAEEDGVPVLLGASLQGKALYTRKGFTEVGKLSYGPGIIHSLMIWKPSTMGQSG